MQAATTNVNGLLLTAVVLALAVIAIRRSPRKLHTAVYILGVMLICGLVGTGIGFAFMNPEGAGSLAALLAQIGGIASSIERMRRYRKGALT